MDKNKLAMVNADEALTSGAAWTPDPEPAPQSPSRGVNKADNRFFTTKDEDRINKFNNAYIDFLNEIDAMEKLLNNRLSEIGGFKRELTKGM